MPLLQVASLADPVFSSLDSGAAEQPATAIAMAHAAPMPDMRAEPPNDRDVCFIEYPSAPVVDSWPQPCRSCAE
jgi:hypothetical protein